MAVLPPSLLDVFAHPDRDVEARAWLRVTANRALVPGWRGPQGETLLHWAALSGLSLFGEVLDAGAEVNAPDGQGRTPLDWINQRLWGAFMEPATKLTVQGQTRLRDISVQVGTLLWNRGGRPGSAGMPPVGSVWSRTGAWSLLDLLRSPQGDHEWRQWGSAQESALHGWILAPEGPDKHRALTHMLGQGLATDERDAHGCTPLWYAVDAWLTRPSWESRLRPAVSALVAAGADPDARNSLGVSPAELPLRRHTAQALARAIAVALVPA